MKRLLCTLLTALACALAALSTELPEHAKVIAHAATYDIFVVVDERSDNDLPDKVSLWTRSRYDGQVVKLITTTPQPPFDIKDYAFGQRDGKPMPTSAVPCIESVWVHPYDEYLLIIQGCPDGRNIYTFLLDNADGQVTHLPCNSGFVGFSTEAADVIIVESYAYRPEGGRYGVISAYDSNARLIGQLPLPDSPGD